MGEPCGEGVLIIHITILAVGDALGAEFFQVGVDVFAGLAEFLVGCIAERADREADAVESGLGGHQFLVKRGGRLGRIAIAPSGNDDQQVGNLREFGRCEIAHVFHDRFESAFFCFLHGAIGEGFRVSRFGAVEHGEFSCRSQSRGGSGCNGSGAGQKAAEPSALEGIEAGNQGIQRLALVRIEWSVLWKHKP